MSSLRRFVQVFVTIIILAVTLVAQEKWSEQQARDWYAKQPWLVGSNYNPASAINQLELDLPTERQYSMEAALYGARLMNVFERSGELVEMSAVSDLVNGWPGGIIQAGRHNVFVTPIYLVNQLYNTHRGEVRLGTDVINPYLDATASRSGNTIFIKAVNTNPASSLSTTIKLEGAVAVGRAEVKTISAPALRIETRAIPAGRDLIITLPKQSVSVITINSSFTQRRKDAKTQRRVKFFFAPLRVCVFALMVFILPH